MPLNAYDESIRPRIFEGFDNAIRGPCGGNEIGADGYGANASAAVDLFLRLAGKSA